MKILAILFAFCIFTHAATPTMWVKDKKGKIPLRIDTIDTQISITGDLAKTAITLRFRNETNRMQEGEFVMPLPLGSTVSSYALEVNGKLRAGVAVEKEQARHAYKTIKRQKIDPGLIEREANNTYRTKVFPIPARGTKLVRLSYIESLALKNGTLHYRLPIDYPGKIGKFTCTVHTHKNVMASVEAADLNFSAAEAGKYQASAENKQLTGGIVVTIAPKTESVMFTEPSASQPERSYFYLNFTPPAEAAEKPRRHPKRINVIWDASDSRRGQNHKKEIQLLDAFFQQLNPKLPIRVTYQTLRNTLQDEGEYSILGNDWSKLRTTLENTFYDGSTALNRIQNSQHPADLTLIFTDGSRKESTDLLQINTTQNTFIFHQGDASWFSRHTKPNFGASINLARTSTKDALRQLTHTNFRIDRILSAGATILPTTSNRSGRPSMVGFFKNKPANNIELSFSNGNGETLSQHITHTQTTHTQAGKIIQRLWGQEKLLELEHQGATKSAIIQHCQKYGLVSDYTSLIVLERFRDYVRFNIPPPEAGIRKKWHIARAKIGARQNQNNKFTNQWQRAWKHRLAWHRRSFTWQSSDMLNHTAQSKIWLDAMDYAFDKKGIAATPYGIIKEWYLETQKSAKNESKIATSSNFTQWHHQQTKLDQKWKSFANLPSKHQAPQPITISIRGLVTNPNTYFSKTPITLKQSIQLAGGLHVSGSLQYISLYRNASAQTYNILSKEYQDIPLRPGDMVVADSGRYDDYSGCHFGYDPFSSGGGGQPLNASAAPAISAQSPQVTQAIDHSTDDDADPFAGPTNWHHLPPANNDLDEGGTAGGGMKPSGEQIVIQKPYPTKRVTRQTMEAFDLQLKKKKNALSIYQKLKSHHPRSDYFYLKAARILVRNQHSQLAIQVLSNISEYKPHQPSTLKAQAYQLGNLELWQDAITLLKEILQQHPEDIQTRLDLVRYQQKLNPAEPLSHEYQKIITRAESSKLAPRADDLITALTERNAFLPSSEQSNFSHSKNLTSDIRCVIYSSDPSVKIYPHLRHSFGKNAKLLETSTQGGRFFNSRGILEYQLKRAMPGLYTLLCKGDSEVTLQIVFYTHWGTKKQTSTWTTVTIDPMSGCSPIAATRIKLKP